MSALFDVIPERLFAPLAAPGAAAYADILLCLFEETNRHQQPLSRDLALDVVADILARPGVMQTTEEAAREDDAVLEETNDDAVPRRAAVVLRYLARCGWVRMETERDFTQACVLPTYTFPLLQVFKEMASQHQRPLQRIIYTIHTLLQAAVHDDDPTDALQEAHLQTFYLRNRLKELQLNIGVHIEKVVQHLQVSDALHQFFATYRTEIMESAYHQLRTSDHVSRFRPGIIEALSHLETPDLIEKVAQNLRRGGEAVSSEDAAAQVADQIRDIREYFEGFDNVLSVIGTRHDQFVDAAVRAVERQLAASTTTSGQLHTILTHLLSVQAHRSTEEVSEECDAIHTLHKLLLADEFSLMAAARTALPFIAEPEALTGISRADEEAARAQTLRHMNETLSRRRVGRFVLEALAGREHMQAAEMPVAEPGDVPLLIYTRLYGDGALGYRVEDDHTGPWIERGAIRFRDFTILRAPLATVSANGASRVRPSQMSLQENAERGARREAAAVRQERLW